MFDKKVVELFPYAQHFFGVDVDIGRLALHAAERLVQHDPGMRQGKPFPRCSGGQEHRAHTGRLADTHGRHVGGDVLHGVVDRQPGGHRAARRVHIQVNVLLGVFRFEEKELGRDHIGHRIIHLGAQKNNPVFQQAGINIIGPFTPTGLLDHIWYIVHETHPHSVLVSARIH